MPTDLWTLDVLVEAYKERERRTRGLRERTLRGMMNVRLFVRAALGDDPVNPAVLGCGHVAEFIASMSERLSPASMRTVGSALRSFFRYLRVAALCDQPLEAAIPVIACWRLAALARQQSTMGFGPRSVRRLVMSDGMRSPRILAVSWGRMEVEGSARGRISSCIRAAHAAGDTRGGKDLQRPGRGRTRRRDVPLDLLTPRAARPRPRQSLRGDLPPPALPGSGPGGRRPASPLPTSQPFRRASGLPGQFVRSSSLSRLADIFSLHGLNMSA